MLRSQTFECLNQINSNTYLSHYKRVVDFHHIYHWVSSLFCPLFHKVRDSKHRSEVVLIFGYGRLKGLEQTVGLDRFVSVNVHAQHIMLL